MKTHKKPARRNALKTARTIRAAFFMRESVDENRTENFTFRLSPREFSLLKATARKHRVRPGKLVRELVLQEVGRGMASRRAA